MQVNNITIWCKSQQNTQKVLTNSKYNSIVIAIDEFYINRKEADRVDENEVSRSTKRDLEE